jgi:hypothetical protein
MGLDKHFFHRTFSLKAKWPHREHRAAYSKGIILDFDEMHRPVIMTVL